MLGPAIPIVLAPLFGTALRKSHGWRSLVGYSPWGRKESDRSDFTFTLTQDICLQLSFSAPNLLLNHLWILKPGNYAGKNIIASFVGVVHDI